jgi:chorismate mutase
VVKCPLRRNIPIKKESMRFFQAAIFMLGFYRFLIDRVDDGIYSLLCMRTRLARQTQRHKPVIHCPDREHDILRRLLQKKRLPPDTVHDIWEHIFHESKHQQQTQSFLDLASRSSPLNSTWFHTDLH